MMHTYIYLFKYQLIKYLIIYILYLKYFTVSKKPPTNYKMNENLYTKGLEYVGGFI